MNIDLNKLISVLNSKKYIIYNDFNRLNIVGIRHIGKEINKFDDTICVFYYSKDNPSQLSSNEKRSVYDLGNGVNVVLYQFPATTEPGKSYLLNPINKKGTAILAEGQYINTYKIDMHNGKYEALCQRLKNVCVYRDADKDELYEMEGKEWGMFGINIHRASQWRILQWIDKNSAGCQVIQDIKDFDVLMGLARVHKELYANVFTYTLITDENYLQ